MRRWMLVLVVSALFTGGAHRAVGGDITTISHGDRVRLTEHLETGRYVLFDFYADWCGPCRALEPQLEALATDHADQLVIRKIDIINWQSPVVAQYGIRSIPHLKLYGPDGSMVREGSAPAVLAALQNSLGSDLSPGRGDSGDRMGTVVGAVVVLALIAIGFLITRPGKRPASRAPGSDEIGAGRLEAADHDAGEWFVMVQGSLEGPYTQDALRQLQRSGQLQLAQQVRRKGDRSWFPLSEVIDGKVGLRQP